MDWITIGSIALNIVAVLSYFKIPDLLQHSFVKRMDHKFKIKLDKINRNYEVLPELFYYVAATISYYDFNYSGNTYSKNDFLQYAKLKNFITQNQFFMSDDIKQLAREIENEVFDFINYKHRAESAIDQSDELIIFEKQSKSREKLTIYEKELEEKIHKIINS